MSTTIDRTKSVIAELGATAAAATTRGSRQMLIVLALALGAILLALSAPVAHAAPVDDTGSEPIPGPMQVHASENPVVFLTNQTTKTITLTWTPEPGGVTVAVEENHWSYLNKQVDQGSNSLDINVSYGNSYQVWVIGHGHGGFLEITTELSSPPVPQQLPLPLPQLPEINSPLIPKLADLALDGARR